MAFEFKLNECFSNGRLAGAEGLRKFAFDQALTRYQGSIQNSFANLIRDLLSCRLGIQLGCDQWHCRSSLVGDIEY
jgi:hypothetical protein